MLSISPFQEQDWNVLLDLANQAVPFAPAENAEWLEARRAFDAARRFRRHYLAWQDGQAVGYGGLEQQGESLERLRVYGVARPDNLAGAVGQALFARLAADARELGARQLWSRELLADEPARAFFTGLGFAETQRATPPQFSNGCGF